MPKSLRILLVVFILLSSSAFSQKNTGKEVTIVGEVIDTQCYLTNAVGSGNGNVHKECAISCATGGIPLSILQVQTGTIFLAGQTKKSMAGANPLLMDYIADKVKVSGRLLEKGGMKFILISKVERVSPR